MATVAEMEVRLKGFEKSLEELQGAIRRIAQENNSVLTTIAKVSADIAVLKSDTTSIKKEMQDKAKKELSLGRTNY